MDKINLKILILTSVGMNTKEIGKLLKLSKGTINKRKSQMCKDNLWSDKLNNLERINIYIQEKNIKLERIFSEEILIILLKNEKILYRKIGKILNCSERTIKRRAKEIKNIKEEPFSKRLDNGTCQGLLNKLYIECCYRI